MNASENVGTGMSGKYTIGVDFGTLSARAVALELATGKEVAEAVFEYPHAVMDMELPSGKKLPPQFALQHPQDYLDALKYAVGGVLKTVPAREVAGIGLDFTTCTVVCVDEEGVPLCMKPEFADEPHAYVKLWKHHGAVKQAQAFDRVAKQRGEVWPSFYGGTSSSEWLFPKILETAQEAPLVYEKTHRFYDAVDWLSLVLTGKETHNPCNAGLKGYWTKEGGFPDNDFFRAVDPVLDGIIGTKVCAAVNRVDEIAGVVSREGAALTGLLPGTPLAMPVADAHAALPALNVTGDGQCLLVVGTSGVLTVNAKAPAPVPGICAQTDGGIFPDLCSMEAGQAGLGDCFDWFVSHCVPEEYRQEARQQGISIHQLLRQKAMNYRPGQSRLVALDWWSGNRSILKNEGLSGLILGLNMQTRPEEIYRALIEATAFGLRVIVDNYEAYGVKIGDICVAGGIAMKDPMLMQIYADVLSRKLTVGDSAQAGARGSAMYAAVAAGAFPDIRCAANAYAKPVKATYTPKPENVAIYDALYREYRKLHDYFGGESKVMDRLYEIYDMGKHLPQEKHNAI